MSLTEKLKLCASVHACLCDQGQEGMAGELSGEV